MELEGSEGIQAGGLRILPEVVLGRRSEASEAAGGFELRQRQQSADVLQGVQEMGQG